MFLIDKEYVLAENNISKRTKTDVVCERGDKVFYTLLNTKSE